MIGLDTNILVRAFAADDQSQTESAVRLLDAGERRSLYVNAVVLVEFAWTMRRAYKWEDEWVRSALNQIVDHPAIVIQHRDCVLEAISHSSEFSGGFADRLIGALNREAGCETTLTFDKDAARAGAFRELAT